MASPFRIFRRNQKVMLAILGIMVMIAFVMADAFQMIGGSSSAAERPPVVDVYGKTYDEQHVAYLVGTRQAVDQFLRQLIGQVIEQSVKGVSEEQAAFQREILGRIFMRQVEQVMGRLSGNREAAAIETVVLARQAEQAGMIVGNDAVWDFLGQLTEDKLDSAQVADVIRRMQSGERAITQHQLFAALKNEILASRYRMSCEMALMGMTPAQRFDWYKRLHRSAQIELVPLAVADFVDKVQTPSDSVLQAFYEKYRDRVPMPGSSEPGFKRPPRATFQYFKLPQEYFVSKASVSDEEIREHYEKNKELYVKPELPDESTEEKPEEKPTEEKPAEKPGEKPEGDSGEQPASEPKTESGEKASGEKEKGGEKEKSTEEKEPAEPAPKAQDESPKAPQVSRVKDRARLTVLPAAQTSGPRDLILAAAQATEGPAEKKADEPKPTEKAADTPSPAKTKDQPTDEKPAAVPNAKEPAETKPDDTESAAKKGDEKQPEEAKPDDAKAGERPTAEAKPKEYLPLSAVRDDIRKALAQEKSSKAMGQILDDLEGEVSRYRTRRSKQLSLGGAAPPPFELGKLAQEKGVGAYETRSLSQVELHQDPSIAQPGPKGAGLGQSYRTVSSSQGRYRQVNEFFYQLAFSPEMQSLYNAVRTQDSQGDAYLAWKIDETEESIPSFAEAKREVLDAWKLVEARRPAREQAEKYAEQARKSKQTLAALFGKTSGLTVIEPGEFTWLTRDLSPADASEYLKYSDVQGVDRPDHDFMQAVFSLSPTEVGVATNREQDEVYVVRVKRFKPLEEDLRLAFATEDVRKYVGAGQVDLNRIRLAWLSGLEKQAGVEWHRPSRAMDESE